MDAKMRREKISRDRKQRMVDLEAKASQGQRKSDEEVRAIAKAQALRTLASD